MAINITSPSHAAAANILPASSAPAGESLATTSSAPTPLTPGLEPMLQSLVREGTSGPAMKSTLQQPANLDPNAPGSTLAESLAQQVSHSNGVLVAGDVGSLNLEDLLFNGVVTTVSAGATLVGALYAWSKSYLAHDLPAQGEALRQLASQLANSTGKNVVQVTQFLRKDLPQLFEQANGNFVWLAQQLHQKISRFNNSSASAIQTTQLRHDRNAKSAHAKSAATSRSSTAPDAKMLSATQINALKTTVAQLSATATTKMEQAATLMHLGRALTANEVKRLQTIRTDLQSLQSQIAKAYAPLHREGLYENSVHPVVLQIKKQLGALGKAIDDGWKKLTDRAGRTADGVGQLMPGSRGEPSRKRIAERDSARERAERQARAAQALSVRRLNSTGGSSSPPQPPNGGGGLWRIGAAASALGGWAIWQVAKNRAADRAQKITAEQSASLAQKTPVPDVVPNFQIFLDNKNQLKNLDRQLLNNDVFAAGLRGYVDLNKPITTVERKTIDDIYAFLADSGKPIEQKTEKAKEFKKIVYQGLDLMQAYINQPPNASAGVKPEQLANIDIKTAPSSDLARARFLRADSYLARNSLKNHYNNHLLFFKMQTAARLLQNITLTTDFASLSQWQRLFGDSSAESTNIATQSDWHKQVTEGQGAQAIQNAQRTAIESFDKLVDTATKADETLLLGLLPDGDASVEDRRSYGTKLKSLADLFRRVGSNASEKLRDASQHNARALQDQIGGRLSLESDEKDRDLGEFNSKVNPYLPEGSYSSNYNSSNDEESKVTVNLGRLLVLPYTVVSNAEEKNTHIKILEGLVQSYPDQLNVQKGSVRKQVEAEILRLSKKGETEIRGLSGNGDNTLDAPAPKFTPIPAPSEDVQPAPL